MKPRGWQFFSNLYQSGGIKKLCELSEVALLRGKRRTVISISKFIATKGILDPVLIRREINSLLVLEKEAKARKLFHDFQNNQTLDAKYLHMLERYLDRHQIFAGFEQSLQELRYRLLHEISEGCNRSQFLADLSSYTDIVLVSNNLDLSFSDHEKKCMLAMEKPLYVYFNIGNPVLCRSRQDFYSDQAAELVMGSYQHVVAQDHQLIFRPLMSHRFLGCWMRIERQWHSEWRNDWRFAFGKANPGVICQELKESLLIEALYPLSLASVNRGDSVKRIPTIGSIALALADALRNTPGSSVRHVWAAGFSLSPSYIFEACYGINLHDFPFEKLALEERISNGSVRMIGSTDARRPELGARQHLSRAELVVEKLNRRLRQRKA